MTALAAALAPLLLAGVVEVPAGSDVAGALARARSGDVVRLGAGEHRGPLLPPAGVRVEGAGPGRTRVVAGPGTDAATPAGDAVLADITLVAAAPRCSLVVAAGRVRLERVALEGGGYGARVAGGALAGEEVSAEGEVGVRVDAGALELDGVRIRASTAGVMVHGGTVSLRRATLDGPFREAGLTASGGATRLEGVVIRAPGPAGLAVAGDATVEGVGVVVAGATEVDGIPGACVQVRRASLRLAGGVLVRCGGAAVEAERSTVALEGVSASGGVAGCLVLLGGTAELEGNVCAGRGPGLVLADGAKASLRGNRWRTDPVLWIDCGSGARAAVGAGEQATPTCRGTP
jgi:hypothetical protein